MNTASSPQSCHSVLTVVVGQNPDRVRVVSDKMWLSVQVIPHADPARVPVQAEPARSIGEQLKPTRQNMDFWVLFMLWHRELAEVKYSYFSYFKRNCIYKWNLFTRARVKVWYYNCVEYRHIWYCNIYYTRKKNIYIFSSYILLNQELNKVKVTKLGKSWLKATNWTHDTEVGTVSYVHGSTTSCTAFVTFLF